jgi:GTP-binding protein
VLQEVLDLKKGAVLVLNKWDLIRDNSDAKTRLAEEIDMKMSGLRFVPDVRVSALTRFKTGSILDLAAQIHLDRRKRIPSPEFNTFLTELNRKYQPPATQGKKVRILYGIQARINPPVFALFSNHPNLILDPYRRFLENQIREKFGFEGVPLTLVIKQK